MNKIPAWLETLVLRININLSNKDKAHSIVLDNKAMFKLTKKDYDYIWHQTSILRLERLLKLQQQQLGKCITTKVPQYLIETINALEVCIDYHRHPTVSKQQIARELVNSASSASWAEYSISSLAYLAARAADLASWAAHSATWAANSASAAANLASAAANSAANSAAHSATWAANSAYSAADAVVYSAASSAANSISSAARAAPWKQEAIDLSKILNRLDLLI